MGLYQEAFKNSALQYLTVEFGTRSALRVLYALREENRWHFFGAGGVAHPAKLRLREALTPDSSRWQAQVLRQGRSLIEKAFDFHKVG